MKAIKSFPRKVREIENSFITMPDGVQLAARIWMPADAEKNPVPMILEHLPYRKRDGTHVRDALTHPYIAGHGYACVRVDMRGNGDSEGVMLDEYTQQELDDACAVIAWAREQSWCTGNVGMMGISWGGFNSLQVAAMRPEGLKAIITLCSTDDRYTDDIHYKGGCVLNENLGWSATMHAYSSRSPDPVLVGERWKDMWMQRLKAEPLLAIDWLQHPHRDGYWKHGSVNENYAGIEAAVLAVGGWNDAYTNAVPRLVSKLKSPAKGIIGPWSHKYPHFAVPEPRIGFLQEALRWWDQWLKGVDTGVKGDTAFRTYIMEVRRPVGSVTQIPGRWVTDSQWPFDKGEVQRLHLNANGLSLAKGTTTKLMHQSAQTVGGDGGEYCIIWLGPEFAGDQRHDDSGSLTFDGEVLTEDIDLVGAPELTLKFSADQSVANVAVRLNSIWPDGAVTRLTYAVFNLCHRNGHEAPQPLEPGKTYSVKIKLDDVACKVPKGHKLRVSLSTSYWPMIWPSPKPVELTVHTGASFIELLLRKISKSEKAPVFGPSEAAAAVKLKTLRKASNTRELTRDQATGEVRLRIVDDFGSNTIADLGLTTSATGRESYSILPDDPLSARQECHWTEECSRENWRVRTETFSSMTASLTHWNIVGRLEAYEDDKLVLERNWDKRVKRNLN
jgi:putative CocE/NonD family hydrolase